MSGGSRTRPGCADAGSPGYALTVVSLRWSLGTPADVGQVVHALVCGVGTTQRAVRHPGQPCGSAVPAVGRSGRPRRGSRRRCGPVRHTAAVSSSLYPNRGPAGRSHRLQVGQSSVRMRLSRMVAAACTSGDGRGTPARPDPGRAGCAMRPSSRAAGSEARSPLDDHRSPVATEIPLGSRSSGSGGLVGQRWNCVPPIHRIRPWSVEYALEGRTSFSSIRRS